MRIVIDLQGAQSESRYRGIGRYTLSFAQAVARNRGRHEVVLALSGLLPDAIESIRAAFDDLLNQDAIRVWHTPGPVRVSDGSNACRGAAGRLVREAFLADQAPSVVHVSSLFEGYVDDAVTSIPVFDPGVPVTATHYDLIPLINRKEYLDPNPAFDAFYAGKLTELRRAAALFAISGFSRDEAVALLGLPAAAVVDVGAAVEPRFQAEPVPEGRAASLKERLRVNRPFLLYTGGMDARKNVPRLIRAFGQLPAEVRSRHQLVIAGKASEWELLQLGAVAESAGLNAGDLVLAGYVSDRELVDLYNLCLAFVFPSWHEGFGLPALEAMRCGAAVIAANGSSLPEVVGNPEALFDPLDTDAMASKIKQVMLDGDFREALRRDGHVRAEGFSWDAVGTRAIAAWESLQGGLPGRLPTAACGARKPRLAFVSPLPPERTGIADYSAELLPALSRHYDVDVIAERREASLPFAAQGCTSRDPDWLRAHRQQYDHVVYQFGNSFFHQYMLPLIEEIPGVVVLHDFYLSGLFEWLEHQAGVPHAFSEALYASHGYDALRVHREDAAAAKRDFPCNWPVLRHAAGIVVHSEYSRGLIGRWYGRGPADFCRVVPQLHSMSEVRDRAAARARLGIPGDAFLVASFGFVDPAKLNDRLLAAWIGSSLAQDPKCSLVFVGENHGGAYGQNLLRRARELGRPGQISITGFADHQVFCDYLAAADVAVQLRTNSRGETSRAILDCMSCGVPTIVNEHGSAAELNREAVHMLPDDFTDDELAKTIERFRNSPELRSALGERAVRVIRKQHTPEGIADCYKAVLEEFQQAPGRAVFGLVDAIQGTCNAAGWSRAARVAMAQSLAVTFPLPSPARRLLLDVTGTCRSDLGSGIERVAKSLLLALIDSPPPGFRTEAVCLSQDGGRWHHRYARSYLLRLLDLPPSGLQDEVVDPQAGDVLLSLDLAGGVFPAAGKAGLFRRYRDWGVRVYATVFDLLPVRFPELFPPGADVGHLEWLETIRQFDGAFCISATIAEQLQSWTASRGPDPGNRRPFAIKWFPLGSDFAPVGPVSPQDDGQIVPGGTSRPLFLMVGTVEPRKAYLEAIEVFTRLWNEGVEVSLAVVGREGWRQLPTSDRRTIPATVDRLRQHPESGRRLFWFDDASDEFLERAYRTSECLIAASIDEGFGLPLIEAAHHGLPVIARDIPIFREATRGNALFFGGPKGRSLEEFVRAWLGNPGVIKAPDHGTAGPVTWQQSAAAIVELLASLEAASAARAWAREA